MAKIALSNTTFSIVPEGTHVFQITAVEYKEDFGKLNITMKTASGNAYRAFQSCRQRRQAKRWREQRFFVSCENRIARLRP